MLQTSHKQLLIRRLDNPSVSLLRQNGNLTPELLFLGIFGGRQHDRAGYDVEALSLVILTCRLVMRHARSILEDLVFVVEPPQGCAIVLIERSFSKPSDSNWVATVGPMPTECNRRYTAKVATLLKTDPRIDWSQVTSPVGPRRIALRHSELIGQPV